MPEIGFLLLGLALVPSLCVLRMRVPHGSVVASSVPALEPVFSLPGKHYDQDVEIEIGCPHSDAELLFTLDGSAPTSATGTVYTRPIRLSAATPGVTVIRARAVLPGTEPGPVKSASYFVGVPATLPMISLIIDPDDLWSAERGIYANPLGRGPAWERPVDVTYVDRDRLSGFHAPAGLRVHGGATRVSAKKSFRLYFRSEYGLNRLDYPLFAQGGVQSFKRLTFHHGGQDSIRSANNWALLRNQLVSDLALQLGGDAARSQPVLVFLNGQSWGIYQIREHIDRWFLADRYGIESADLLDTPAVNGSEAVIEGDREHWDHLVQFVETHDLADPANYAYMQAQVDLENLIDYTVLQIYSANTDWLHTNVNQFRPRTPGGRWRWFFWDSDWSFGLGSYSTVDSNIIIGALNPDHPDTGGLDTLLLRKLLENPEFCNRFLTRTAGLLNTVLSSDAVIARIDALAAEMAPDITYETSRWWKPTDRWEASVQALRDFARARPDVVRQHFVEAFSLDGMVTLTFNPPSTGTGYVAVEGQRLPELPWRGVYFRGTVIRITAVPALGYRFAGWDGEDLPASTALTVDTTRTLVPRFEPTDKDVFLPGDVVFTHCHIDGIEGDWLELQVRRRNGVDLRGWRVTDNDTKWATNEGSLIFAEHPAFAHVPRGTTVRIFATQTDANGVRFAEDDLGIWDRLMVLYVGNGNLDINTDPWFNLGPNDNLVLLAPGSTSVFDDDQGIDFVAGGAAVTPASFGILADGVLGKSADVPTVGDLD